MDFDSGYRMTIDGQLVDEDTHIEVVNPATGEIFAKAPNCSAAQLDQAVAAAKAAFAGWRKTPIAERQPICSKRMRRRSRGSLRASKAARLTAQ